MIFTLPKWKINPNYDPENQEEGVEPFLDLEIPMTNEEIMEQCKPTIAEMMSVIEVAKNDVCYLLSTHPELANFLLVL